MHDYKCPSGVILESNPVTTAFLPVRMKSAYLAYLPTTPSVLASLRIESSDSP